MIIAPPTSVQPIDNDQKRQRLEKKRPGPGMKTGTDCPHESKLEPALPQAQVPVLAHTPVTPRRGRDHFHSNDGVGGAQVWSLCELSRRAAAGRPEFCRFLKIRVAINFEVRHALRPLAGSFSPGQSSAGLCELIEKLRDHFLRRPSVARS
jgi:hypothetical protein